MKNWKPSASIALLKQRAKILAELRAFFAKRNVLEVETPALSQAANTDPYIESFSLDKGQRFLHTSPEYAMKRLLAAGSGSIYQICKAFRNGELGRFHNPEFTLLEWYRVGFNLNDLMNEVADLMMEILTPHLAISGIKKISYSALFFQETKLNALKYSAKAYQNYAIKQGIKEAIELCGHNHDLWLDFIFSHKIQPTLVDDYIYLVHSYPASQASLARLNEKDSTIADRVEVFIKGVELGNGFFELADSVEQEKRFEKEIAFREKNKLPSVAKDDYFLAALSAGIPDCCGIAIGLDRLLMLLSKSPKIEDVLSFSVKRA